MSLPLHYENMFLHFLNKSANDHPLINTSGVQRRRLYNGARGWSYKLYFVTIALETSSALIRYFASSTVCIKMKFTIFLSHLANLLPFLKITAMEIQVYQIASDQQ